MGRKDEEKTKGKRRKEGKMKGRRNEGGTKGRPCEKKSKRRVFLSGIYKRKAAAVEFILVLTARPFRTHTYTIV